jgi:mono/diheme cytochrome c family protein
MRLVATLALLSGCSLYFDEPPQPGMTPAERDWMNLAYPILEQECAPCHASATPIGGPNFLAGGDALAVRATILAFQPPVISLESPTTSRILTKGLHSGPQLTPQEESDLLTWLQAEREQAGVEAALDTPQFAPLTCSQPDLADVDPVLCPRNVVALDALGMPTSGLRFITQPQQDSLVVTKLEFLPGAGTTATLFHPRFVAHLGAVEVVDDQLANLVVSQPGPFGPAQLVLPADFLGHPISLRVEMP